MNTLRQAQHKYSQTQYKPWKRRYFQYDLLSIIHFVILILGGSDGDLGGCDGDLGGCDDDLGGSDGDLGGCDDDLN